jgi:amino acid permease
MSDQESSPQTLSPSDDKVLPLIDKNKKRIRKKKFTYSNPNQEMLSRLDKQRNKNFFKRNFGSLQGGSLRAVVMYWVRMTMGIGVMALPFYISQMGVLTGSIIVTLAAVMSYFSFKYIFTAQILTGKKDLVQIAGKFLPRWIVAIYSYTLILDVFTAMVIYTVVSWNLFAYLVAILGLAKDSWIKDHNSLEFFDYNKEVLLLRAIFLHVLFLGLVPLLLQRSLEALKIVSQVFMASLVFIVVILLAQTPLFYHQNREAEDPSERTEVSYLYKPIFRLKTFSYIFSIILAFYVQPMLMSLRKELLVPNIKRLKKVATVSVGTELCFFLVIGVACYITFGDKYTTSLIILRKPLENYLAFEWVFRGGLILFFISNAIGIPFYNVPLRDLIIRKIQSWYQKGIIT